MIVKNKKGFTLVELLAVIVILFVVLAIAVPVISNIVKSSTKNAFESDIKMVLKTVELKLLEDKLFDPSIVNESNVKELFNIDDSRYQSLNIQRVDNKLYITVVGKGKWNDLNACGTKTDLRLVEDIKVCNTDIIPPVITILGEKSVNIYLGETYEDAGATAIDNVDGDITDKIVVSGDVNPNLTGEYTLTYNVIDNAGNVTSVTRTVIVIRGDYNMAKGVNYPVLAPGMTPIKWNGTAESNTIENDSTWYDYSAKKWANAKTADGSYWVWIPRFIYNISSGWNTSDAGEVKIQFSKGSNDNWNNTLIGNIEQGTTAESSNNKWTNHPAFTFGDTELTGIWVAKFEASNSNNNVKIVPNASSWTNMYINDIFNKARSMETNNVYGWGTSGNGIDTHLMKNSEWGAVAYLSKSNYGINDEVWINPSNTYFTGCSGATVSQATTTGCLNSYNTTENQPSSTTGNVYGIYDMSGGAYDVVAAYYDNGHDNLRQNGLSLFNAHSKYKDVYTMGSTDAQANNYALAINKKGDAVYETSSAGLGSTSWYSDRSNTPYTSAPWFIRSGLYSNTAGAGIFYYSYTAGAPNDGVGFRPVLLVGEGL